MYTLREIAENFKTDGNFKGTVLCDEPMILHTTFRVGGPAPLFIEPADIPSLERVLDVFRKENIPWFILGGGSNVVVSDAGFDGAVISTCGLKGIQIPEREAAVSTGNTQACIRCGAGVPMAALVSYCTGQVLSGLEPFAGLPGTIGGAVYMNARCFGCSVSDILESVMYVDPGVPGVKTYQFNVSDWDYKKSPFQCTDRIVVSASFRVIRLDPVEKKRQAMLCAGYIAERNEKGHFRYPSAGSVFRNNRTFGKPTGKIIDEAGLCGTKIGGAQIAPWHGNIIINVNNATQADIRRLVDYTIDIIKKKTGFILEPEIIFCGM